MEDEWLQTQPDKSWLFTLQKMFLDGVMAYRNPFRLVLLSVSLPEIHSAGAGRSSVIVFMGIDDVYDVSYLLVQRAFLGFVLLGQGIFFIMLKSHEINGKGKV